MTTWTQSIKNRQIEIDYDRTQGRPIRSIAIDTVPLTEIFNLNPIQFRANQVALSPDLISATELIFDAIGLLKGSGEFKLTSLVSDFIFGIYGNSWAVMRGNGLHIQGANLLFTACRLAWKWEAEKGALIHKGTPYYFLAQTLLEIGDIDTGFTFVFLAVEEDKRTYAEFGDPQGYRSAPAYMFVTSVDNPNNSMYHLISGMILKMHDYFTSYQNEFGGQINSLDFDRKFLQASDLEEIAFFFIFTLQQLIRLEKTTRPELLQNEFSKLRNLDFIFNLCLIVDKVLCKRFSTSPRDTIANNVHEFSRALLGITDSNPSVLKRKLNVDINQQPDNVVPALLNGTLTYDGQPADRRLVPMILVWHLRNYGGHNIKGQQVLITDFQKVVKEIMYALFLAVDALP